MAAKSAAARTTQADPEAFLAVLERRK